jgi:DNA-binding response OmpR family regulator/outer membrane biosynthesis protein TonB
MAGETILLIDKDAEITQSIESTLESNDYLVFTAPSGDVGITMANKISPALIFVNPTVDGDIGLELCKTIHSTSHLTQVPIVVLSAFEGATDPKYASLYGIVDSLKKPFTPEELLSKTENLLLNKPSIPDSKNDEETDDTIVPDHNMEKPSSKLSVTDNTNFSDATDVTMIRKPVALSVTDKTVIKTAKDIAASDETIIKPVKPADITDRTIVKSVRQPSEKPKPDYKQMFNDSTDDLTSKYERTYIIKTPIRRKNMGSRSFLSFIIIVLLVAIVGGGFFLYKNNMLDLESIKEMVGLKTAKIAKLTTSQKPQQPSTTPAGPITFPPSTTTQQTPSVMPSQPTQAVTPKPEPTAPSEKPKETVKPIEKLTVKPEQKPSDTTAQKTTGKFYSVQIGAFKNMSNAEAVVKQQKEKGVDAFIHKTVSKNKTTLYIVLIGKHTNRKEALQTANNISTKDKAVVYIK